MAFPVIRQEIEVLGKCFSHRLIERETTLVPAYQRETLGLPATTKEDASHLDCSPGVPAMVLERQTFGPDAPVTAMCLTFAPGHRLKLVI